MDSHFLVKTQIAARGITDSRVLEAMLKVPRHEFVPSKFRERAYGDHPISIGEGQTISQPYIVAFMTEILEPGKNEKILEIGTGSGYQAAVLAEIYDHVFSIEINRKLAENARVALEKTGYSSVHLRVDDGYQGWKEHAPFDGIIVTCASSRIPEPLVEQLKEGGRMIIPVDVMFGQELVLLHKIKGKLQKKDVLPVRFVPMINDNGRGY
ncbi:protein-L-isoaspartate(D-aspartate) O-methyltransferase [bacterium]|nr:protein-L-isoaspartate(D-aspartate) O-methyltransferase [bacterium]